MSEATKGPWHVEICGMLYDINGEDGTYVASIVEHENISETLDNANLIARAPQMDVAIRKAIQALKSADSDLNVAQLLTDALREPESVESDA